jgi:hypothetical protein
VNHALKVKGRKLGVECRVSSGILTLPPERGRSPPAARCSVEPRGRFPGPKRVFVSSTHRFRDRFWSRRTRGL